MARLHTFRVVNIPGSCSLSDVEQAIEGLLDPGEGKIEIINQTLIPSPSTPCSEAERKRGIMPKMAMLFSVVEPLPKFLAKLCNGNETAEFELKDEVAEIDANFMGLTQLYYPAVNVSISADIIAFHDLDSHPYDSWVSDGRLQKMWLRDFFKKDFPSCRTMIYGYNARLKSKAVHSLLDYTRAFLNALKRVRRTDEEKKRPLILIGHGLGGIILAQTILKARFDEKGGGNSAVDTLLPSMCGILFFGVPHRGALVGTMEKLLREEDHYQRLDLLDEIRRGSSVLKRDLDRFVDLTDDFNIYTIYAMNETRDFEKDAVGKWVRSGDYIDVGDDSCAVLQLPSSIEKKIPADADHPGLIKFKSNGNSRYQDVQSAVQQLLDDAPQVLKKRFDLLQQKHVPSAKGNPSNPQKGRLLTYSTNERTENREEEEEDDIIPVV